MTGVIPLSIRCVLNIHSRLSRCSTARGSSTRLSLVVPTKVKVCKSFLITEGSLKVENKEHLFDFFATLLCCILIMQS